MPQPNLVADIDTTYRLTCLAVYSGQGAGKRSDVTVDALECAEATGSSHVPECKKEGKYISILNQ